MKKVMLGFAVGAKCPIRLPEGPVLKFSQAGITMFVSIPKPDRYEKKAFKAGHPVKFDVSTVDRMGFLVADFGENFVLDAPFDVGLEQDYDIPELALTSPDSKVLLTLVAVDSKTNVVFGLRCISLSPSVSAAFANVVEMQRSSKIAMAEHEANIRRAYAAHSSPEALMGDTGNQEKMNTRKYISGYRTKLPPELMRWYCYFPDCGHNLYIIIKSMADLAFQSGRPQDYLAPVPFKTALRSFEMRDGYIIVDVEYDRFTGINVPPEDYEY